MAAALKAAGSAVTYDEFADMDHYQVNLAKADKAGKWVETVRRWMTAPPPG